MLRDIVNVAGFELYESITSRKFLVFIGLYVLAAGLGAAALLLAVGQLEAAIAEQMAAAGAPDGEAANLADSLRESESFVSIVSFFVGDEAMAKQLLEIPYPAVFNAWLGFLLVPFIVMFTSSAAISDEVASGSSRFALVRVSRLSWVLGKYTAHVLLMIGGIAAGVAAALGTTMAFRGVEEWVETALWMARFGGRVGCYGIAFVGLVLGVSQLTESRYRALAAVLGLRVVFWVATASFVESNWPAVAMVVDHLIPDGQEPGLWSPEIIQRSTSCGVLIALSVAYLALGFLRFGRRDA